MNNSNNPPQEAINKPPNNENMTEQHKNTSKLIIVGLVFLTISMALGIGILVFQNLQLQKSIKELAINPETSPVTTKKPKQINNKLPD